MHQCVFPERYATAGKPMHPVTIATAATPPVPATSAGASAVTRDLLVMGYLSAVAEALDRRGVAESSIRMGAPDSDRLSGSLALEPIVARGGLSWGCPLSVGWDEDDGWSAELRAPAPGETARRFLHPELVAAPSLVAGFVADLVDGRDVGMVYPVTGPSARDPRLSRPRLLLDLARYAIPEVRRWLGTQH
jgi:Family of unknown function (DUF6292)